MSFKLNTTLEQRKATREKALELHMKYIAEVSNSLWETLQEYTTQYTASGEPRVHQIDGDILRGAIESFIKKSNYVIIPKIANQSVIHEMVGYTDLKHCYREEREAVLEEMAVAYSVMVGKYSGDKISGIMKPM